MANPTLERRVKSLELQVSQLQSKLQSMPQQKPKDWRRTIGAFTDDEGLKAILQDALRLREADRKKSRSKKTPKRGKNR
jgi:predicted  nucleic acid-binding Zn-ribbon protein